MEIAMAIWLLLILFMELLLYCRGRVEVRNIFVSFGWIAIGGDVDTHGPIDFISFFGS